ncbi:hypothetical protein [Ornithinibacillus halotolerans]|uniref:Uncharacterized protein n=1 Tax=Ornithinibacillus halotolerans TaxID=1274357 RepID=A0A916S3T6_9BACI|nr:hypothetical protein [Ornithinibacillus halotolerans]GGA82651.1 hypothetical protein GCM10008025_27290 [Ornithinibacillus halotolerans]
MQTRGKWLPILASVGVGAATYYTMRKNNQSLSQTIAKMVPFVTGMKNTGANSGKLGPFGMA